MKNVRTGEEGDDVCHTGSQLVMLKHYKRCFVAVEMDTPVMSRAGA